MTDEFIPECHGLHPYPKRNLINGGTASVPLFLRIIMTISNDTRIYPYFTSSEEYSQNF